MACNWITEDYFGQLMCADRRSHTALEMLVDDLHAEKERTISTFLCHSGSEDFLWGLVRLFGNDTPRVAGNAAYIIGTLAESELGCFRILSLAKGRHPESRKILSDLTRMLTFDDPESVMNAAGTMGTLAESAEGREWMLSEPCAESMLDHVTILLHVDNLWTASNAALVLARLCISEDGCTSILKHSHSQNILTRLILALGVDEAGRGMNAAFAIGRLCDMDSGRERLLSLPDSEKMISSLAKMLSCEDTGASKNACFALSCLATSLEGHGRLLKNAHSEDVLRTLSQLLSAEDSETGWFAAMTLRTLASQPKGCLRLREFPHMHANLKKIAQLEDVNPDLKEEVVITLEILKRLDAPDAPSVTVLGPDLCHASWNQVTTKSGFEVRYQLFEGSKCFYNGYKCQCEISSLSPHTTYSFKVRAVTEGDESAFSEPTTVTTEEDLPEAPQNVRVLGVTITQLKIGWDPPENFNGVSKGYYVYQGKTMVEHTTELSAIISGLTANTAYEVQVCVANSKGKGPRASCIGTTAELGAHAPSKPHVQVLGRNEVHVSWEPPEVPMGRITRYDLSMNGKNIYSGTDLSFGARRLTPDTEYTFIVTALTNEGKFESKATKKRTAKDEFDPDRPPLYQPPKKEEESQKLTVQKKRKSTGDAKSARAHSAKGSLTSCTSDRPLSANSDLSCHRVQVSETPRTDKDKEEESRSPSPAQKAGTVVKPLDTKKENVRPRTHKELTPSSSTRNTPSASGPREHLNTHPAPKVYSSRIDKPSGLSKPSFPVTVSYVSIQGGDDQNLELDAIGPDFPNKKTFIRSPTFHENMNPTLRVERSKTTLTHHKSRSNRTGRLGKVDMNEQRNGDLSSRVITSGTVQRSSHSTPDHKLSVPVPGNQNGKPTWLPKPAMPSPDYLDGNRGFSANSDGPSLARSMPSPRTSLDFALSHVNEGEMEPHDFHYHRRKRKDDEHTTLFYTRSRTPVDSYFVEAQQAFIQRTNTFINSHRPSLKKNLVVNAPIHLLGSASLTLPDNKLVTQRPHNKFIPMQLRTQPNNLTANQLQRMNTTLSEPGRAGLPGRRLEALTRSHTQVSLRSQPQSHPANRSANPSHRELTSTEMEMLSLQTQGIVNGIPKTERMQPRV